VQDRTNLRPEPRDEARPENGRGGGAVSRQETPAGAAPPPGSPRGGFFRRMRLPTKLLAITILFVMLAEVLVFVPSIANYRVNWLNARLTSARLAALAADARLDGVVPPMMRREILSAAQVRAVAIKRDDVRRLVLPSDEPLIIDASFDLRESPDETFWQSVARRAGLIRDALYVFIAPADRMILVYGHGEMMAEALPDSDPTGFVEVVLPETPLRDAMLQFGFNILILSIIISVIAATAVYLTLIQVLVRPMTRITGNMLHFSENPEDASRIIQPGGRSDEIGIAETELARMQGQLNQLLQQRRRLADLGLAVSKINHDLRNMLASAQLISDRLGELPDPSVQRFAPKLIASLDRAIKFCNETLRFGRAEEAAPRRELFPLRALVEEVGDGLGLPRPSIAWQLDISATLQVDADRDQLFRVLNNLVGNAIQALDGHRFRDAETARIAVSASRADRVTTIELADNGPGVPPKARENLFQAFKGGARKGGSGLGLAIAAELVRAHGGEMRLIDDRPGAVFRITIPDRAPGVIASG
jgi:signal transduction histidine kinase